MIPLGYYLGTFQNIILLESVSAPKTGIVTCMIKE